MRNIKMTVAYVGTRYAGWQVQPGRETVQGVLEAALSRLLQESIRIAGAGRTDAGVHARGQVANFPSASRIPLEGLQRGLNARLPDDIRIMRAEEAAPGFHARSDARSKEYLYRVARTRVLSPFDVPFAAEVHGPLDAAAMGAAAAAFVGTHDFTSMCAASCRVENRVRTVTLSVVEEAGDFLQYRVRAGGFLQHMVRTMAGTLILVGRGRIPADAIGRILLARDRRAGGPCAPARGLTLERVFYEEGA
ncbi:MAG TPA: tRNA pseudouridine(38-40) synthase TruA [Candidatus Polarisedimenticolia bacterium]|nr:tRNA pseudouridine(38-40) synthase TruA [Candidatus Polarisedimenticolia bacterium]